MKKLLLGLLATMILGMSGIALADETVVTSDEWGQPIVVHNDTYTTSSAPSYYYYEGHRCYAKERKDLAVTPMGLHMVNGGTKIYCYPYP